jgi:hypothetical protein
MQVFVQKACECRIFCLPLPMSTRREKSKPQTNRQLQVKERISNYGSYFRCDYGWSARYYLPDLLPHSEGQALDESQQSALISDNSRDLGL